MRRTDAIDREEAARSGATTAQARPSGARATSRGGKRMTTRRWLALPAAAAIAVRGLQPEAAHRPRRPRPPAPSRRARPRVLGAGREHAARGDQARVRHPRPGQPVHPADHRRRERRGGGPQRRPPGHRSRGRRRRRPAQGRPDARRVGRPGHRDVRPGRDHVERAQRDRRLGHPGRAVQPARDLGQGAVRRRALGRERAHPRPEGRREARRRERHRQGHHRQLLPGLPGAREPGEGRPGVAQGRRRARDPRPIRRQGRGQRELRGLGGAARRQPGRQGPHRPVRAGHRQPRQAPGGQRRDAVRRPAATT